jgi:hypothetical protein
VDVRGRPEQIGIGVEREFLNRRLGDGRSAERKDRRRHERREHACHG